MTDFKTVIDKIDQTINLCHLCIIWVYGCLAGMGIMYLVMS